jgi:hypothetical protein
MSGLHGSDLLNTSRAASQAYNAPRHDLINASTTILINADDLRVFDLLGLLETEEDPLLSGC